MRDGGVLRHVRGGGVMLVVLFVVLAFLLGFGLGDAWRAYREAAIRLEEAKREREHETRMMLLRDGYTDEEFMRALERWRKP